MPRRGQEQVQRKRHRASILNRRRSTTSQQSRTMMQSTIRFPRASFQTSQELELFPSPEDDSSGVLSSLKLSESRQASSVPYPIARPNLPGQSRGEDVADSGQQCSTSCLPQPFSQAVDCENIPPTVGTERLMCSEVLSDRPLCIPSGLHKPPLPTLEQRVHHFRGYYSDLEDACEGISPSPPLATGDEGSVFTVMRNKEQIYVHSQHMLKRHPVMTENMRAIVIDWMCEVSEAYRLHRESFYLGVDVMDRYLLLTSNICKSKLQLIAVTALFTSSKIEEIYPPKLQDFAFVTDGACTESQICSMELVMMHTLKWDVNPVLLPSWVKLYLQCAQYSHTERHHLELRTAILEQFPVVMRLLDLAIMHTEMLAFDYSLLAAAAVFIFIPGLNLQQYTGYSREQIEPAVQALVPIVHTLNMMPKVVVHQYEGKSESEARCYQSHLITQETFEQSLLVRDALHQEELQITPERRSLLVVQRSQDSNDSATDLHTLQNQVELQTETGVEELGVDMLANELDFNTS